MSLHRESWFGSSLPSGWGKTTVRAAFSEKTVRSREVLGNYLSLTANAGVIPYGEKGDVGNKAPEDMSNCKKVSPGDFVLNSMNFGIGSFGVSGYEGVCSSVYLVLQPKSEIFNSRYLERIFELSSFQTYAQSLGNGILAHRAAFGWDKLRNIEIPLPPRYEQDAIVKFLDSEIAHIDLLTTKLLELEIVLSARFESVLNKEFSEMVGSGIPIRYLAKHLDVRDSNADLPLMSVSKIHGVISRSEITDKAARAESLDNYKICKPGDLVINRMSANTGALGVASQAGRVSPDYMVLEFFQRPDQALVEHLFKSSKMRSEMSSRVRGIGTIESVGVRTPRLTWSNLADIRINFPTTEEQAALSQKISDRKRHSDQLLEKTQQVIQALRSRKASLINSLVTGKINVLGGKNG